MKRALKIAGITVGVILLLLVGGSALAYFLVDLDKVLNEQVAKAKPQIEEKLGREVQVGAISTRFFPTLGGSVAQIKVAPATGSPASEPALLEVGSVGFDVAVWRAIFSGGKELVVDAVYVDGLRVNLVRAKDGTLSYQDILDKLAASSPAQEEATEEKPAEPMSPETLAWLQKISVGEIRLGDAEVRLTDFATATGTPAESRIRKLNLRVRDVRLSDPIRVHLDAALFADSTNFVLDTEVGPLPADLQLNGPPRLGGLTLRLDKVDLSRLAPYLGPAVPVRVDSALASADWKLGALEKGKPLTVAGFFELAKLQLGGGQPFDLRLDAGLEVDLDAMGVRIDKLDLKAGSVAIAMAGALSDLSGAPKFKDFTVRSSTLDPAVLLRYYPAAKASLPPGMRLEGPITLDVKASGDANRQTVAAKVDLTALDLLLPDTFLKPAGTPMGASVDGDFTADDANLRALSLRLDELDVQLSGTVKNFSSPSLDLKLAAKPFSFDRLARLAPAANKALAAANAKASGDGKLAGHVKGTLTDLDAALELGLLGVKLDVPGTRLDGDLTVAVTARGNPEKSLSAALRVDADKAVIAVDGLVNKTAATPALVDVAIRREGDRIDVQRAAVRFAELQLGASGDLDLAAGATHLKVELARLDLEKFARTVTAIPAAQAKKGFVDARLSVQGDPNRLETMELRIDPLNAVFGSSDVRGSVRVVDLSAPKVELQITSKNLDIDALMGESSGEPEAKPAKQEASAPAADDPSLKAYGFHGTFDAKRVVVSEVELRDFKGEVTLADGKLRLEDATFGLFGGTVSAKGTEAEIWKGKMPFRANLQVKGIEINEALTAKTRYANTLYGKTNLGIELAGEGFETADLEKSLNGKLAVSLLQGKLARASLTQAVVGDLSALEKVPGVKLAPLTAENAIRDLAADFEVRDGKLNLKKPMTMNLDGSRLSLTGALGIAGGLFFEGNYFMPPALVDKLTAGRCKSEAELQIPVVIRGTVDEPKFKPDATRIVTALAERCVKGAVAEKAEQLVGDKAKQLLGVSNKEEAEAKARAEAERLKAETEAKAKAEADRIKAEAEAKAKAAADKAKQEAEAKAKAAAERAKKDAAEAAKQGLKNLGF